MKPTTIVPHYEAVPAELRGMPIWLLWDYKLVDGRWTKIPLVADASRRRARSNDHRTWRPFGEALTLVNTVSGLGMCITGEYCGFDLDCCRDKETGEVAPWAQRIVSLLNSYTEISPSGEGLHVIVKLKRELPTGRRMRGGKERCGWEIALFDKTSPRYFTVTGVIVDAHNSIRACDPVEFFPEFEMGGLDPEPVKSKGKAADSSEQKLNKRARLIKGEWEGLYPSQSEADAALTWFFAFDYDDDPVLIDRAFRNSGMMRPKWDEPRPGGTYGSVTIAHCLDERRRKQKTRPFILNDEGKIKPLLTNAITALRTAPEWQGVLAFNEFSLYAVARTPAPWQADAGAKWTDYDDSRTTEWLQRYGVLVNTTVAHEAVYTVAREKRFHPVRDYFNSLTWDQSPRLEGWLTHYLGVTDSHFVRAVGTRWLISAVARIMRPGCQADYTLLLEGPQGIRKSTALRALAGDDWFTDHISDLGSKDSRIELHGKLLIEFSELSAVRRAELERIKAFLTARIDNFRPPYGRSSEAVPRSCVFAASCNDETPFTDATGNRRFWPVRCAEILINALSADRDQIWAEAYQRYLDGAVWWLDTKELNQAASLEQEERYDAGVWDEVILAWLEDPKQRHETDGGSQLPIEPFDSSVGRVTVTDVLIHAVGKDVDRCTQSDRNQVQRCLIHAGWKRKQVRVGARRLWFYEQTEAGDEVVNAG